MAVAIYVTFHDAVWHKREKRVQTEGRTVVGLEPEPHLHVETREVKFGVFDGDDTYIAGIVHRLAGREGVAGIRLEYTSREGTIPLNMEHPEKEIR